ncbi:MAG: hypothetical protein D6739_00555 [Nitrospirae bacterium]|nr:MAG: hypothetical protein D6739_00555 [Nitrospirota bacterium]
MEQWSQLMDAGTTHYLTGDLAAAEEAYERALAEAESLFEPGEPRHLLSLAMLAAVLALRGRHAEAEGLYRRQLALREEAELEEDADLAECLEGLARCLRARGADAEAEGLEARAREVRARLAEEKGDG